jgi:hypothetical protein
LLTQHRILRTSWLPRCQAIYGSACGSGRTRSLRYLTVYERDPQDVFLIKRHGLIPVDKHGYVGTVLFNRHSDPGNVFGTALIGAVQLEGDFLRTVLVNGPQAEDKGRLAKQDSADYQEWRQTVTRNDKLKQAFPFDAISIDLDDEWSNVKGDILPVRLIRGLTRVLEWQRDSFIRSGASRRRLTEFKICLTVRKPVSADPPKVKKVCRDAVSNNLRGRPDETLNAAFLHRSSGRTVSSWAKEQFGAFAALAAPKALLGLFRNTGWDIELGTLIDVYEYSAGRNRGERITIVADLCRHRTPNSGNSTPPGYLVAAEQIVRQANKTVQRALVLAEATEYLDSAAVKNEAAVVP